MTGRWQVGRHSGPARALIDRPWPEPAVPSVWVLEATGPAVVLGSTQASAAVDAGRAEAGGVDVVRRRGGGGAVLVEPGGLVWVDVFVPAGDPLWDPDVGRAFAWLGAAWARALADSGVPGPDLGVGAPDGPLPSTPWSRRVCFAGLGPGEVTVEGAKVVGMCQRRARPGALFQCAVLLAWEPDRLLDLLDLADAERRRGSAALAGVARGVDVEPGALVEALLGRLP